VREPHGSELVGQTQLALQFMKPRMGTQAVQLRVNFQKNNCVGVVAVRFFEPVHGFVIFAEARIDNGHIKRGNLLLLRLQHQLVQ
jgi:hypothetical protein